jgi:hypothetical protein
MQVAYKRNRFINARKESATQDRIRRSYERSLNRKLINMFDDISRDASKFYKVNGTQGMQVYLAKTRDKVENTIKPHWYSVIKTFTDRMDDVFFKRDTDFYNILLARFINRIGANHISDIDDTTRKHLQRTLLNAQSEGLGVDATARIIRERYSPKFSRYRSAVIARTETHSAATFASHEVGKEYAKLQPALQKQWVATMDDRTRLAHRTANGQIVAMEEKFIVDGMQMEYCGDPAGGARNIINCRCVVIYIEPETDVYEDKPPPITPPPPPNPAPFVDKPPLNVISLAPVVNIQRRTGELRGKTDKEIAEMYDKKLKSELTPTTEKVFNNTALPKVITQEGKKGYYRPSEGKVVSNLDRKTLAHEYGHHIDYATSNITLKAWSETNEEFIKAFRLDKKNLALGHTQLTAWKERLLRMEKGTRTTRSGRTIHYSNPVPKHEGFENVSDIIDAMSDGKFYTDYYAWGHGKNYYRKGGAKEKETFANLFSLQNDKESMELLRQYIPNTMKAFDERMLELAK